MNEGGGYVQFAGQVCLLTSRNPPSSTKHWHCTQCTQVWTAVHCVLSSSALWLIAVFIHTGSFIHWPEKHFSHWETRLVFQTLCPSTHHSKNVALQSVLRFDSCKRYQETLLTALGSTTFFVFKYFLYLCCLSKACLYEISFIFINVNEYLKNIWLCVINKY